MSNVVLKSDLCGAAHLRKAPFGLRKATNQRNQDPQQNPLLKKIAQKSHDEVGFDNYNVLDDDDDDGVALTNKLRAFQQEVTAMENDQKSRQTKDDEIVSKRMEIVEERQEKIKAAIAGERFGEQQNENDKGAVIVERPSALKDNLYSESYYVRENQRQAKKQAKEGEKQEWKESQEKERKRKGTLANLAVKMKMNPEKYEEIQMPKSHQSSEEQVQKQNLEADDHSAGVDLGQIVKNKEKQPQK